MSLEESRVHIDHLEAIALKTETALVATLRELRSQATQAAIESLASEFGYRFLSFAHRTDELLCVASNIRKAAHVASERFKEANAQ